MENPQLICAVGILCAFLKLSRRASQYGFDLLSSVFQPMILSFMSSLRRYLATPVLLLILIATGYGATAVDSPATSTEQLQSVTQTVTGILQYARWPSLEQPPRFCVAGQTAFMDTLLQPGYLAPYWQTDSLQLASQDTRLAEQCQALYLGALPLNEENALFNRIRDLPILTISEHNSHCTIGSIICLQIGADSTGFQVNLDSLARSGVRVHPNVLMLAKPAEPVP